MEAFNIVERAKLAIRSRLIRHILYAASRERKGFASQVEIGWKHKKGPDFRPTLNRLT